MLFFAMPSQIASLLRLAADRLCTAWSLLGQPHEETDRQAPSHTSAVTVPNPGRIPTMMTAVESPVSVFWHILDCLQVAPDEVHALIREHAQTLLHAKEKLQNLQRIRPGLVTLSDEAHRLIALAESALA